MPHDWNDVVCCGRQRISVETLSNDDEDRSRSNKGGCVAHLMPYVSVSTHNMGRPVAKSPTPTLRIEHAGKGEQGMQDHNAISSRQTEQQPFYDRCAI